MSKTVYEPVRAQDLPKEKRVGAADVPAPVVVHQSPAKVPSPPAETSKVDYDPATVHHICQSFDRFVVDRYGENDQLVKLWRKHAEDVLDVDPSKDGSYE